MISTPGLKANTQDTSEDVVVQARIASPRPSQYNQRRKRKTGAPLGTDLYRANLESAFQTMERLRQEIKVDQEKVEFKSPEHEKILGPRP